MALVFASWRCVWRRLPLRVVVTSAQQRNERKEVAENEVERKTDEAITNFPDVLTR